jgi:signal transduction histidine kinase
VVLAVVLTAAVAFSIAAGLLSAERGRRRQTASLNAIEFVRTSFASRLARGEPMDELFLQVVEALHDSLRLDAAEIWLHDGGMLERVARAPHDVPVQIAVTPQEEPIIANAVVSGPAWVKTWLPALLENRQSASLRFAPLSVSGQLLGLIVIERHLNPDRLARDADVILAELAREVGAGVHRQRLDASLQASLHQLRQQARDLQASRARIVAAADAERRRMERDLHDGAQQFLVTIAVKARLIQQLARTDPARSNSLIEELTGDVESALDELRTLAHGIYPPLLSSGGLKTALAEAGRRSTIPVRVETTGISRYPPEIEAAVYYCCLEALQNAAKHAGDGAEATVSVSEVGDCLRFVVSDDGAGFDIELKGLGSGLTNMSDRLGAVGGTLGVESALGSGARVAGEIPLTQT